MLFNEARFLKVIALYTNPPSPPYALTSRSKGFSLEYNYSNYKITTVHTTHSTTVSLDKYYNHVDTNFSSFVYICSTPCTCITSVVRFCVCAAVSYLHSTAARVQLNQTHVPNPTTIIIILVGHILDINSSNHSLHIIHHLCHY